MAEIDYKVIEQFTLSQFRALPEFLSEDNEDMFENALYLIDRLCADNPNTYRLLMPFHKLTFGWQSAYTHGFTWNDTRRMERNFNKNKTRIRGFYV